MIRQKLAWLLLRAIFTLAHSLWHQLEILALRGRHLGLICSHVAILGLTIVLVEDWALLDALILSVDELLLLHRHILAVHKLVGLREHLRILLVLNLLRILHLLLRNILRIDRLIQELLARLVLDWLVRHLRLDPELVLLRLMTMLRRPKELLRVCLLLSICLLLLKGLLAILTRRSMSVIWNLTIAR